MKLKDRYSFPAIFHYANDGISISFPDLAGCLLCADTTQKAFVNVSQVLQNALVEQLGLQDPAHPQA
ncbi:MAG: type II toxin-antitoxin system HicB family antitoxin [Ethanoligenens sp.]